MGRWADAQPDQAADGVRLAQQRNDRLAAAGEPAASVTDLASVRAVAQRTDVPGGESDEPRGELSGDDDDPVELDALPGDELDGGDTTARRSGASRDRRRSARVRLHAVAQSGLVHARGDGAARLAGGVHAGGAGCAGRRGAPPVRRRAGGLDANLGPIITPQMQTLFDELEEIVQSNRQDGDRVRSSAVLSALPGLGKSTVAISYGVRYHREQIECTAARPRAVMTACRSPISG